MISLTGYFLIGLYILIWNEFLDLWLSALSPLPFLLGAISPPSTLLLLLRLWERRPRLWLRRLLGERLALSSLRRYVKSFYPSFIQLYVHLLLPLQLIWFTRKCTAEYVHVHRKLSIHLVNVALITLRIRRVCCNSSSSYFSYSQSHSDPRIQDWDFCCCEWSCDGTCGLSSTCCRRTRTQIWKYRILEFSR